MKKPTGFEKFANKKKAGTIKEQYRKERREEKQDRSASIDQLYEEKRKAKKITPEAPKGHFPRQSAPGTPIKAGKNPKESPGRKSPITLEKRVGSKTAAKTPDKTSSLTQGTLPSTAGALMPLNKFIAHAGVCARRDAAELVKKGGVLVNGTEIKEPGYKVSEKDEIKLNGKRITLAQNLVYILLNKPKDYITTTEDPQGRKTVLDLIRTATTERVYPIGRLDRNTSGVLLFTNDGDLAQTLSHPKHEIKKIYEVTLDKPLTKHDFETIVKGITLEDGFIAPDALGYADPRNKAIVGIEIHSGRNRIVRRIFEHLKYDVRALDRVMYAGLTKKNVNRGKWRFLNEREVRLLKHFNKGGKK